MSCRSLPAEATRRFRQHMTDIVDNPPKRKRGRPRKNEIREKTTGHRGKVGRPKGDAGIMAEYKARMLASPKSSAVLDAIFEAALDDSHKHQAAAWKLLMDRMLPVSMFDKEGGGQRPSVSISITTTDATTRINEEPLEGEIVDE